MTNTSPGALVPPRPTELKIGGAILPISSTLSTVGEATSPTPASGIHNPAGRLTQIGGKWCGDVSSFHRFAGWALARADGSQAASRQIALGRELTGVGAPDLRLAEQRNAEIAAQV